MFKDFVKVTDSNKVAQILNIRQITRVHQMDKHWQVLLTSGDTVALPESEAARLTKRLLETSSWIS